MRLVQVKSREHISLKNSLLQFDIHYILYVSIELISSIHTLWQAVDLIANSGKRQASVIILKPDIS